MPTLKGLFLLATILALAPTAAFASGFKCQGDEGYRAKLFNYVDPESGTRTPAFFVLSSALQGTLLTRDADEIRKTNRLNTVRYSVDGSAELNSDKVILQIRFLEAQEELAAGETAPAQLIFVKGEERQVYPMTCVRYLKGEPE